MSNTVYNLRDLKWKFSQVVYFVIGANIDEKTIAGSHEDTEASSTYNSIQYPLGMLPA